MKVSVVQTNPVFGEVASNVKDAISMMEHLSADLYVLPELFNTGYNFIDGEEIAKIAETASGFTFQCIAGFAEKSDRYYNSSALVGPAGLVGVYRKVHLFYIERIYSSLQVIWASRYMICHSASLV